MGGSAAWGTNHNYMQELQPAPQFSHTSSAWSGASGCFPSCANQVVLNAIVCIKIFCLLREYCRLWGKQMCLNARWGGALKWCIEQHILVQR